MIQFFSQLTIRFEHYQSHTSLILVYFSQFEESFSYPDSKKSFLKRLLLIDHIRFIGYNFSKIHVRSRCFSNKIPLQIYMYM